VSGASLLYPNFVVAVVFSDRAEVPAVDGLGCAGAAGTLGWGYWRAIQFESATELGSGLGEKARIHSRALK
jgi:hypothetical protein